MSAYQIGSFLGAIVGMALLAHIPYAVLSRIFKESRRWIAIGLSPSLWYPLAVFGAWGDTGIFLVPTVGYLLGALVFVVFTCKRTKSPVLQPAALAFICVSGLYIAVGQAFAIEGGRQAATLGCLKTFERETAGISMSYSAKSDYCRCITEGMNTSSCKDISLLWSNQATEKCAYKWVDELKNSEEAGWRLLEIRDRCVAQHLPSALPELIGLFQKGLSAQFASSVLTTEESFKALKVPEEQKSQYVECFFMRTARKCKNQTFSGIQRCLVDAMSSGGDEKDWPPCLRQAGITK